MDKIEYLKPYGDRILIEIEVEEKLDEGNFYKKLEENTNGNLEVDPKVIEEMQLLLGTTKKEEKFKNSGVVVAISDSITKVSVGAEVIYNGGGVPLEFEGKQYRLIREQELLYIVDRS